MNCMDFLNQISHVMMKHGFRKANQYADTLARKED